jgi:hypothetical protein
MAPEFLGAIAIIAAIGGATGWVYGRLVGRQGLASLRAVLVGAVGALLGVILRTAVPVAPMLGSMFYDTGVAAAAGALVTLLLLNLYRRS